MQLGLTVLQGHSVARTHSPGTPLEYIACVWNTVLGPALLVHPSRDMVTSPQVTDKSSIVSSRASVVLLYAYIGEIKVF